MLCEPTFVPPLGTLQGRPSHFAQGPPQASSAPSAGRSRGEASWPISFRQTGLTGTALNEIAEALPEQIALLKQWPEGIANAGNTELLSTEDPADARAGGLGRCGVAPPAGWPEPRLRAPGRLRALLSAGGGWPPRAPRIEAPSSFLVSSLEVPGMSLGGS